MKEEKISVKVVASDLPHQEHTYVNKAERLMDVYYMINKLFWALIALVVAEITGFGDNFAQKHLFVTRFLLVLILITFLTLILTTALENPPVKDLLLSTVIVMVMACAACFFLVLLVSTITAIITCFLWTIVISIFVVSRWKDMVQQVKN